MRLALIGHGAMGRLVEARARDEGHEVALVLSSRDAANGIAELGERLRGLDMAIDFSVADAVLRNVSACAQAKVPLVEGTTGWNARQSEVERAVEQEGGALVHGANFSVGVQIFYRMVAHAAELFAGLGAYDPFIEEAHHARKRDAPSGTAIRLRDILSARFGDSVTVASTRAGHIPGTHRVGFDSAADQITLTHTARSREGFASGALLAAGWLRGRQGIYDFSDVMDEILNERMKLS